MNVQTPQECINALTNSNWKDFETLDLEVDEIVQKYGFKLSKKTGSKQYLYYICFLAEESRTVSQQERLREREHTKCGKSLIFSFI